MRVDSSPDASIVRWVQVVFAIGVVAILSLGLGVVLDPAAPAAPIQSTPTGPFYFAWGQPVNDSGTSQYGCSMSPGIYCYSIEIVSVPGWFNASNLGLSLRNGTHGGPMAWPTSPPDLVVLFSPATNLSCATYDTATGDWSLSGDFTGTVNGGFTIAIVTGGVGPSYGLAGDQLVYDGVNGASGTAPSAPFP